LPFSSVGSHPRTRASIRLSEMKRPRKATETLAEFIAAPPDPERRGGARSKNAGGCGESSGCCVSVTRSGDYTLKDIYTSAHLAANGQFLLVASSVGWCRRSRSPPLDQIRLLFASVETFCGRQCRDSDTHRRVCSSVIPFNSRPVPDVR
jgi:hypothetical protein